MAKQIPCAACKGYHYSRKEYFKCRKLHGHLRPQREGDAVQDIQHLEDHPVATNPQAQQPRDNEQNNQQQAALAPRRLRSVPAVPSPQESFASARERSHKSKVIKHCHISRELEDEPQEKRKDVLSQIIELEREYQIDNLQGKSRVGRKGRIYKERMFSEKKGDLLTQLKRRYCRYLLVNEQLTREETLRRARADVDAYYKRRCSGQIKKVDARFEPIQQLLKEENWAECAEEEQRREDQQRMGEFYYKLELEKKSLFNEFHQEAFKTLQNFLYQLETDKEGRRTKKDRVPILKKYYLEEFQSTNTLIRQKFQRLCSYYEQESFGRITLTEATQDDLNRYSHLAQRFREFFRQQKEKKQRYEEIQHQIRMKELQVKEAAEKQLAAERNEQKKKNQEERPQLYGKDWLIETEKDLRQCVLFYGYQHSKIQPGDEKGELSYLLELIRIPAKKILLIPENSDARFLEQNKRLFDTFIPFKNTHDTVEMLKIHLQCFNGSPPSFPMRPVVKKFKPKNLEEEEEEEEEEDEEEEEKEEPRQRSDPYQGFQRRPGDVNKQLSYLNSCGIDKPLFYLRRIDIKLDQLYLRRRYTIPLSELAHDDRMPTEIVRFVQTFRNFFQMNEKEEIRCHLINTNEDRVQEFRKYAQEIRQREESEIQSDGEVSGIELSLSQSLSEGFMQEFQEVLKRRRTREQASQKIAKSLQKILGRVVPLQEVVDQVQLQQMLEEEAVPQEMLEMLPQQIPQKEDIQLQLMIEQDLRQNQRALEYQQRPEQTNKIREESETNRQEEQPFNVVQYSISKRTLMAFDLLQDYLSKGKKDISTLKKIDEKAKPDELSYLLKQCHFCGGTFGSEEPRKSCRYCFTQVHLDCSASLCDCFCKSLRIPYRKDDNLGAYLNTLEFPINPLLSRTKWQGIQFRQSQSTPESVKQELDKIIKLLNDRGLNYTTVPLIHRSLKAKTQHASDPLLTVADKTLTAAFHQVANGCNAPVRLLDHGQGNFGIQAMEFIPKFTLLGEYAADIIPAAYSSCLQWKDHIMIYVQGPTSKEELLLAPVSCSNWIPLINHSEKANCAVVRAIVGSTVKVVLYASKNIEAGEELLYNYNSCFNQYPTQGFQEYGQK